MELLICTNGSSASQPALEYGVWFAAELKVPIVLMGIVEKSEYHQVVEKLIENTRHKAIKMDLPCRTLVVEGSAEEIIARMAAEGDFLTLTGPLGRSSWRRLWRGRSFRNLMKSIESPIIYVPSAHMQLRKILLCTGGLHYAEGITHIVGQIAQGTGAQVTLLHVTEPTSLKYPIADELKSDRKTVLQSTTPQAKNIQRAIEEFGSWGVPMELKQRHGYIVREILGEIRDADYDMVGLGSSYGVRTMRHLFTPNIGAEVLESINLPVVVARYGFDLSQPLNHDQPS